MSASPDTDSLSEPELRRQGLFTLFTADVDSEPLQVELAVFPNEPVPRPQRGYTGDSDCACS